MARKKNPTDPFRKRKQKVGKKKLEPVAATKAEIHSGTIFLRKQGREPEAAREEYLNYRKLSFNDLLSRLRHFTSRMRRDALLDLHRMVEATKGGGAQAVPRAMHGTLLNSALPLLCDQDGEVRRAAAALLKVTVELLRTPVESGTGGGVSEQPPLQVLLPLMVRHCAVALTHITPEIRSTGSQALLHVLGRLQGAPLPDCPRLLAGTEGVFAAASRPAQGHQPAAMRAYLLVLESALLHPDQDAGEAAPAEPAPPAQPGAEAVPALVPRAKRPRKGPSQPPSVAAAAAAAAAASTRPSLGTTQGIFAYMQEGALGLLEAKWIEATQERGRHTVMGDWELGLLRALVLLVTAALVRRGGKEQTPAKVFAAAGKGFAADLRARLAANFPFASSGPLTQRANAQIALLLSTWLPTGAADLHQWRGSLLRGGGMRALRPEDCAAICVVFERLHTAGPVASPHAGPARRPLPPPAAAPARGAPADAEEEEEEEEEEESEAEEDDPLAALLQCTAPASPGQVEVLRALRRIADRCVSHRRELPHSLQRCLPRLPRLLHYAAQQLQRHDGPAPADPGAAPCAGALALVPTAEGGCIQPAAAVRGAGDAAREAALLLLRGAAPGPLPRDVCEDVLLCMFGFADQAGVRHGGAVGALPPDVQCGIIALLPAAVEAGVDAAELLEGVDHMWGPSASTPPRGGKGASFAGWMVSHAFDVLQSAGACEGEGARAVLRRVADTEGHPAAEVARGALSGQ